MILFVARSPRQVCTIETDFASKKFIPHDKVASQRVERVLKSSRFVLLEEEMAHPGEAVTVSNHREINRMHQYIVY